MGKFAVRSARGAVLAAMLGISSCGGGQVTNTSAPSAGSRSAAAVTPTDYSRLAHWLAAPSSADKKVDVFYIYPTAYSKESSSDPDFCAVDNPQMMKGAQAALLSQAMAFGPSANIYAPYYRQVDALYQLALPAAEQEQNI